MAIANAKPRLDRVLMLLQREGRWGNCEVLLYAAALEHASRVDPRRREAGAITHGLPNRARRYAPTGQVLNTICAIIIYTGMPTVTLYENVSPSEAASGSVGLASGIARRWIAGT